MGISIAVAPLESLAVDELAASVDEGRDDVVVIRRGERVVRLRCGCVYSAIELAERREGMAGVWGVWGVWGECGFPGEDAVEIEVPPPLIIGGTLESCREDEDEER